MVVITTPVLTDVFSIVLAAQYGKFDNDSFSVLYQAISLRKRIGGLVGSSLPESCCQFFAKRIRISCGISPIYITNYWNTMEASFSSPTVPSAKRPGTSSTASLSSTTLKVEIQIASLPGANRIPSVTRCLESRSQSREETPTWSFAPTSAGAPSVMRSIVPPRRPPRAGANNNNNN